ncbi:MAG: ATP-binding protein, partial [Bacteroidales bacterium]|nr:ATP-binding protein [Bacteroidales bacterium]
QNTQGWEKFIRRIFDTISTNIYITGSNSKLLSTDIATELRGRTISYTVYPLNFKEFLNFNNIKPEFYGTEQKNKVLLYSKKFLELGGFPEIVKLSDDLKIKKLQDYFNSIIYKDLIERYDISNPAILKFFIKKIFNNVTKPLSVNKIYNELKSLGYKISNNVLYEYLEYIQATFTAVLVNKFSYSPIKQAKSEKKAYTIDCGFLTAIDYSFSENYGKLLENMIATEVLKAEKEIMFFKEKKECDFIIKDKKKLTPMQVCYSTENQSTKERELKGLYEACKFLNIKKGKIITFEEENTLIYKDVEVEIIPAYKFMINLETN